MKKKTHLQRARAVDSTRVCPCCNRLARPGDPGFGQRMTFNGVRGYWRKECVARIKRRQSKLANRGQLATFVNGEIHGDA